MTNLYSLLFLALLALTPPAAAGEMSRGEVQVDRIRADRPRMATSLDSRPAVRDWIVTRFNEAVPMLLWDPGPTVSGRDAETDARNPDTTWVRVNPKIGGIDQLVVLLFELHNVGRYEDFHEIHERAVEGELTREEYAEAMLGKEFEALLEARSFFSRHVDDLSRKEEKEARIYWRLRHGPETLDEHIRQFLGKGYDLRDHFRTLYDTEVLREREERRKQP